MKKGGILLLIVCIFLSSQSKAQSNPTVKEVENFFSNSNILLTYREGGAVYGTYYTLEIHYCPNGYGLYGSSSKQTVMGNYQNDNWQEFGTWKVMEQGGAVGLYYQPQYGQANFVPIYKLPNGNLFIREGLSIVKQGQAICY